MAEKFDSAPFDKHAADPKEAAKADSEAHETLDAGLIGTFPTSDPVSAAQPAASGRLVCLATGISGAQLGVNFPRQGGALDVPYRLGASRL